MTKVASTEKKLKELVFSSTDLSNIQNQLNEYETKLKLSDQQLAVSLTNGKGKRTRGKKIVCV